MAQMPGSDHLVLCSGTLRAASLAEKCAAAMAGGFGALTLWPSDVARARSEGLGLADIKRMIADHGLVVADLDPLLRWLPGEEIPPGIDAASEAEFYAIAEGIGGRSLNVVQGFGRHVSTSTARPRRWRVSATVRASTACSSRSSTCPGPVSPMPRLRSPSSSAAAAPMRR